MEGKLIVEIETETHTPNIADVVRQLPIMASTEQGEPVESVKVYTSQATGKIVVSPRGKSFYSDVIYGFEKSSHSDPVEIIASTREYEHVQYKGTDILLKRNPSSYLE